MNTLGRLLTVLVTGALLFGAVLGSLWLAQIDTFMTMQEPAQTQALATPTLFPTLVPVTPTPLPPNASPVPETGPSQETTPQAESGTPSGPSPVGEETQPEPQPTSQDQVCEPPAGWPLYEVKQGDTFFTLAERGRTNIQGLLQGNCLEAAPELETGDTLYVPAIALATPTPYVTPCGPPQGWPQVRVRRGETLFTLAVRYGTTVQALQRANCLDSTFIQAGSYLYVPPSMVVPPSSTATRRPPATSTSIPTPTAPHTSTPYPTKTSTSTPQPTVVIVKPTSTPPPTATPTPTATPVATKTPSAVPTATPTSTQTPVPTPTWTPRAMATATPEPTSTPSPTASPTATTALPSPTPTSTVQPTAEATATATGEPTSTLSP